MTRSRSATAIPGRLRTVRCALAVAMALLANACSSGGPSAGVPVHAVKEPRPASASPSQQVVAMAAGGSLPHTPEVVHHGARSRRLVALTFDSNLTPFMERELDQHRVASFDDTAAIQELIRLRVPATFFLSGLWVQRYPRETQQLARVPFFEIGSHAYSHRAFTHHCYHLGVLPPSQMVTDIEQSERLLKQLDPLATGLFRFPGGCYDRLSLAAARAAHVRVVQYDVASGDAFGRSVQAIVGHTLTSTRNGSIVVLHITGGNTAPLTSQALPEIVSGLRSRGFSLVTVSQLMTQDPPLG